MFRWCWVLFFVSTWPLVLSQYSQYPRLSTLAGSGAAGYADGAGTLALFSGSRGMAVDLNGNVYIADTANHRIRMVTTAGVVTTVAGSGVAGYADGTGTSAKFNSPSGIAVDVKIAAPNGMLYVCDSGNHRIRVINSGVVTTLAGNGTAGYADGTGSSAMFNSPSGVFAFVYWGGRLYIADSLNHRIRTVTSAGVVTTVAGGGVAGYSDGVGTQALFNFPYGVVMDYGQYGSGNLLITDRDNHCIRMISGTTVTTPVGTAGVAAFADSTGSLAAFFNPTGFACNGGSNFVVADRDNYRVRSISLPNSFTFVVTTVAGNGSAATAVDGTTGAATALYSPYGVALQNNVNSVYVVGGNAVLKVTSFACTSADAACAALGDLYYATSGAGWTSTGWNVASGGYAWNYCSFNGVTCVNGNVTQLCVPLLPGKRVAIRTHEL